MRDVRLDVSHNKKNKIEKKSYKNIISRSRDCFIYYPKLERWVYDFDQTTVATLERSPKFKTKRNVTQNLTCTHAQLQQKPNSIQLYIMFLPSKLFEQNKTIYFLAKKLLTQGKG